MFEIKPIKLLAGSHQDTAQTGQGCFMNVISYLNGEETITDDSTCVCDLVRPIAITINDRSSDELRQKMLPFVLRAMGSDTGDAAIMDGRVQLVKKYAEKLGGINFKWKDGRSFVEYHNALTDTLRLTGQGISRTNIALLGLAFARMFSKAITGVWNEDNEDNLILQLGMDYLDEILPPLTEANELVVSRANKLVELQLQPA